MILTKGVWSMRTRMPSSPHTVANHASTALPVFSTPDPYGRDPIKAELNLQSLLSCCHLFDVLATGFDPNTSQCTPINKELDAFRPQSIVC